MTIVDLVLSVCLVGQPAICEDRHLSFQSSGSLSSCMFRAQPTIAQWAGEHPRWAVKRWHCEWAGAAGSKA